MNANKTKIIESTDEIHRDNVMPWAIMLKWVRHVCCALSFHSELVCFCWPPSSINWKIIGPKIPFKRTALPHGTHARITEDDVIRQTSDPSFIRAMWEISDSLCVYVCKRERIWIFFPPLNSDVNDRKQDRITHDISDSSTKTQNISQLLLPQWPTPILLLYASCKN